MRQMLLPWLLSAAAVIFLGQTVNAQEDWLVDGSHSCSGMETDWDTCPGLPPCEGCFPANTVHCQLSEWSDWSTPDENKDCFGLCYRSRNISQPNNRCGSPCSGYLEDTKVCPRPSHCPVISKNCLLGDWKEWSGCTHHDSSDLEQNTRYREVIRAAQYQGKTCENELAETVACGKRQHIDCLWGQWSAWTKCSLACGRGHQTRTRDISVRSKGVGAPCVGQTWQEDECNAFTCADIAPCKVGAWSMWSGCDSQSPNQKKRERYVTDPAVSNGLSCNTTLMETAPCDARLPRDCTVSSWTTWSDCTKTCEGGSMQRTRAPGADPQDGGSCPREAMTQVALCNNVSCTPPALDCKVGPWQAWDACSVSCGVGSQGRKRIVTPAMPGGAGCADAVKQTKPCQGTLCMPMDCVYSQWSPWDACDATCDGGMTRRWRHVQTPAANGGQCLPALKGEIKQCNVAPCRNCTNGTWNVWGDWSTCSASCGNAYRSRTRYHLGSPSACGFPAEGNDKEYQICDAALGQPNCGGQLPCQLGDWEQWTVCSSTCIGMQSRKRQVVTESNAASSCTAPIAEMAACFKGSEQELKQTCQEDLQQSDCQWGSWDPWSTCSVTCGKGVQERRRVVLQYAQLSGAACQGADRMVTNCSVTCPASNAPKNCEVGQWSSWSGCTKHGWPDIKSQKSRSRVIVQLPDKNGQPCATGLALTQTRSCVVAGEDTISLGYCAWSAWAAWSECPAHCTGTRTRERKQYKGQRMVQARLVNLTDVYNTVFAGACSGREVEHGTSCKKCQKPICFPTDLGMSAWSPWVTNSSTQLCTRSRTMTQAKSTCGSYIGLGATTQTKPCPVAPLQTCKFSPNYLPTSTVCSTITDEVKTSRIVPVGFPSKCKGVVGAPTETQISLDKLSGCVSTLIPKKNCTMGAWTAWSVCSDAATSCNGVMKRTRTWTPAQSGGVECTGSTHEQKECTGCVHNGSCHFSDWGSWTVVASDSTQTRRTRKPLPQNGSWTTAPCQGNVEEVKANNNKTCSISHWSDWSTCSQTCGQGFVSRKRWASQCGIGAGVVDLEQASPCLLKYCPATAFNAPVACELSAWGTWSGCSHTCDGGSQTRERGIAKPSAHNGQGCTDATKEARACGTAPCVAKLDCAPGDWTPWSPCSKSCHGGQMSRTMNLSQWPKGGGHKCPEGSIATQLRPCGIGHCPGEAVDAKWGPWVGVSECSSTCHGGFKMFKRELEVKRAGSGKEAVGLSEKTEPCNTGVPCTVASNCVFQGWTEWSACETFDDIEAHRCTGTSVRSRGFVPAKNGGVPCNGSLKETIVCPKCFGGPPAPCTFGQWSTWTQCNVTCGGGQMTRTRSTTDAPLCNGTLHQTAPCGTARCAGTSLDCQYSPWQDWGACQQCGGSRIRVRTISQYPHPGGKACENGNLTEVGHCSAACSSLFCAWGQWNEWSACSSLCGAGKRSRTRILSLVEKPSIITKYDDEDFIQDKMQELYRKSHALEAQRHHDLLVAFSLGGVAFLALMVVGMVKGRVVAVAQTSCEPSSTDVSLAQVESMDFEGRVDYRTSLMDVGTP